MIWEYFWIYKLPRLQLSLSSNYYGLFGLNGLETQKYSNLSINDIKQSCWYEKIIKFRCSWFSGLCLAYMTFVGLFHFSCNPWNLRRLLVCLKVISEQYNLKNCHQTKILKIDHCDNGPNIGCPVHGGPPALYQIHRLLIQYSLRKICWSTFCTTWPSVWQKVAKFC